MKVKMVKVVSSNINFIGRSDSGVVVIEFKGGTRYRYDKISEDIHKKLMAAPSKGKFIYYELRPIDNGKKIKFLIDEQLELIYEKENK